MSSLAGSGVYKALNELAVHKLTANWYCFGLDAGVSNIGGNEKSYGRAHLGEVAVSVLSTESMM